MLSEAEIYEVLSECFDPEMPVNIVDPGLIYGISLDGDTVTIRIDGDLIANEMRLLGCPTVIAPLRMSPAARQQLNLDD